MTAQATHTVALATNRRLKRSDLYPPTPFLHPTSGAYKQMWVRLPPYLSTEICRPTAGHQPVKLALKTLSSCDLCGAGVGGSALQQYIRTQWREHTNTRNRGLEVRLLPRRP